MGKGFAKKKKAAKKMQEQFLEYQKQMEEAEATGSAGNGLVIVTLNGQHEMTKIAIKPECVDPDDIEGLEDLVKAAYNDAAKKLQKELPGAEGMPDLGLGGGMPDLGAFGF